MLLDQDGQEAHVFKPTLDKLFFFNWEILEDGILLLSGGSTVDSHHCVLSHDVNRILNAIMKPPCIQFLQSPAALFDGGCSSCCQDLKNQVMQVGFCELASLATFGIKV